MNRQMETPGTVRSVLVEHKLSENKINLYKMRIFSELCVLECGIKNGYIDATFLFCVFLRRAERCFKSSCPFPLLHTLAHPCQKQALSSKRQLHCSHANRCIYLP